jgi:hypothetical protein
MAFSWCVASWYGRSFVIPYRFKDFALFRPNLLTEAAFDEANRVIRILAPRVIIQLLQNL